MRLSTQHAFVFLSILDAASPMMPLWIEPFAGPAGASPNLDAWNVALALNTNGDIQEYTASSENLQLSGQNTLQIIPRKNPQTGKWTSARIESKGAWVAQPGRRLQIQSDIRLGPGAPETKLGIWPAFWVLGDDMRHGRPWPICGEIDIFEHRNGEPTANGTMHCGTKPESEGGKWAGGPCEMPFGLSAKTDIPDPLGWHTWALVWDRTPGDWRRESITWMRGGVVFHTVDGNRIGDEGVWTSLAHRKVYILLNVAVGGAFTMGPNEATQDGPSAMMEVRNLGVYEL